MGEERRKLPELKFPERECSLLEAQLAAECGAEDSFASVYQKAVEKAHEHYRARVPYTIRDDGFGKYTVESQETLLESACGVMSGRDMQISAEVARTMQEYLISHDGRVDVWPDSAGMIVSSYGDWEFEFRYDYFGVHYVYDSEKNTVTRSQKEPVYCNAYHISGTNEWRSWEYAKKHVESQKKERGSHAIRLFGISLGGLLCGYVTLSLLTNLFIPGLGEWFLQGKQMLAAIASGNLFLEILDLFHKVLLAPVTLLEVLKVDFGRTEFYWIAGLFMLLVCLILLKECISKGTDEAKEFGRANGRLKKSRQILKADGEKLREESEKWCKASEEFAEEWHRAWFEWVCRHKGTAAEVTKKDEKK